MFIRRPRGNSTSKRRLQTLEELGFKFDEQGRLVCAKSGKKYDFEWFDQKQLNYDFYLDVSEYIQDLTSRGYGVIVANPNENFVDESNSTIARSASPEEHIEYLQNNVISKLSCKKIAFICHSYGAACVINLLQKYYDEFTSKVYGVATLESIHNVLSFKDRERAWIQANCKNWASSNMPAGEPLSSGYMGCPNISSGNNAKLTPLHIDPGTDTRDRTPYCAREQVIEFIEQAFAKPLSSSPTAEVEDRHQRVFMQDTADAADSSSNGLTSIDVYTLDDTSNIATGTGIGWE
ncbi:hypothetical protein EV182_000338 [Spiromyces aspiralis]|uniref:Uncharacterized protein n=1 Tax=Spiromyces aspiralis TaxID=68401 RepID=A0ACC1HH75_9FUNG|nr:hypothetical protein EV182_000338 [Spiromyces aspiralis]